MGPFGVVCAHAGMERIANTPAVETAADFRNCRLDLVFMAKSPELSDGPSFLKCLRAVQQASCWARIPSNRLLNAPMYSATEGRRQHYLYSFSYMKYPVAAEFLRLPGICDDSIQETWSHDCPVGLSFRGLFPNPRKPNRAHKLGVACQRIRQGGGAEPIRIARVAEQCSAMDSARHRLCQQGRQQRSSGGLPTSAEDFAEQHCGAGRCSSNRVRSGQP